MLYNTHLLRHVRFTIGQNIYRIRSRKKLTQRKLAHLTGIPDLLLDQYEIGKNEIRIDDLLKISCVLNVPMRIFVESIESEHV